MQTPIEQIKKIIEDAKFYQSGDNSQPWSFVWANQILKIHHSASRAEHPLNPDGMASQISLGCLIEAISISASQFSLKIKIRYHEFSNETDSCWAQLEFEKADLSLDPLFKMIPLRSTDRRLFTGGALPLLELKKSVSEQAELSDIYFHSVAPPSEALLNYIVQSERVMMEFESIVLKVLEWTRFTKSDAERTRDGLSLQNMGVKFHEIPAMLLMKAFPAFLKLFRPLMIHQHMNRVRTQIESSAGLICVSIPRTSQESIPNSGRLMYRLWLALTNQGFGVQPLTIASSLTYCAQHGLLERRFPQKWIEFFKTGSTTLRKSFEIPETHEPIWMIRTGRSTPLPQTMRTLRRPLEDFFSSEKN